jgi:hypothetical protein
MEADLLVVGMWILETARLYGRPGAGPGPPLYRRGRPAGLSGAVT